MITYSLTNLLLDAPELDYASLVGPVVPMRWMSNLLRLAILEESDRQAVAAGHDPRHQAEIRRLRRMSMSPAAGRYYPVGDDEADQDIIPDQIRQIVEHWRSNQPMPTYDNYSDNEDDFLEPSPRTPHPSPLAPNQEDAEDEEDGEDEEDEEDEDFLDEEEEYADAGLDAADDADDDSFDLEVPYTPDDFDDESEESRFEAAGRLTEDFEKSVDGWADPYARVSRFGTGRMASFAKDAATAVVVALLVIAAIWFIQAYNSPTPPHPASFGTVGRTKIVPSAVPRDPISIPVCWNRPSPSLPVPTGGGAELESGARFGPVPMPPSKLL